MMKRFSVIALGVVALLLGGCLNTYNSTSNGMPTAKAMPQARGGQQTIVNVNGGMTSPAPSTFTPTSYQEVYTTEYTPCGPVVKKAIVPIYGQAGSCPYGGSVYNQGMINAPMTVSAPSGLPVIGNVPPASPVTPAIAEPVAWFGPSASPVYSSQTNWF